MKKTWLIALLSITLGTISCSGGDDDGEKTVYTVTFDANGGSPTPAVQRIEAGGVVASPSSNPTKSGYVFMFWSLSSASTAYNFNTPVSSNIILKANWKEEGKVEYWKVSWVLNGGTWPAGDNHATQVVKGGTLAEPAEPVKTDNTFEGWYKESSLSNKVTFPYDVSSVTSDFTLYAKWSTGNEPEPGDRKMFTSIAALKTWFEAQPAFNTFETAYKIGLKDVNLDAGNNWGDLGLAIHTKSYSKYVDLDLSGCTGTAIPDGRREGTTVYGVFAGVGYLTSIVLPKTVKSIGKFAFYSCYNLSYISLPAGLESIEEYVFQKADFKTITLPHSLRYLGNSAFTQSKLESIEIPAGVEVLEEHLFYNCEKLKTITLHEGLKTIKNQAFRQATALESIVIPESVQTIGEGAFYYCSGLKSATLPSGLKTIEKELFYYCTALSALTIPASVTSMGDNILYINNILTELVMLPVAPPTITNNTFYGAPLTRMIKVPAGSVDAYKTATGWSALANNISAIGE